MYIFLVGSPSSFKKNTHDVDDDDDDDESGAKEQELE